jgi:hypothetical protein
MDLQRSSVFSALRRRLVGQTCNRMSPAASHVQPEYSLTTKSPIGPDEPVDSMSDHVP